MLNWFNVQTVYTVKAWARLMKLWETCTDTGGSKNFLRQISEFSFELFSFSFELFSFSFELFSFRKDNTSNQTVPQGVGGLSDAKGEEASLAVDPPSANAHGVPPDLVEDHPDAVDLVGLDAD